MKPWKKILFWGLFIMALIWIVYLLLWSLNITGLE